jgi:hypothetical protein
MWKTQARGIDSRHPIKFNRSKEAIMMKQKFLLLISVFLITSSFAQAAVLTSGGSKASSAATNEAQLLEELTGKKASEKPTVAVSGTSTKPRAVAQAPSKLHLNAGYQAFMKKDYILALKHYNTVLAKYSKSSEVRLTYMAKAKLYNEMGLAEPAQRNLKLAQQMAAHNSQTK